MTETYHQNIEFTFLLVLVTTLIESFVLSPNSSFASTEINNTSIQPEGTQDMGTSNATTTNIILVHSPWADGSSWSKVIPILQNTGR
jgi:hypothetical protein